MPDRPPGRRAQRARPADPRRAAGAGAAGAGAAGAGAAGAGAAGAGSAGSAARAAAAAEEADLDLLSRGALEIEGRLMAASNATLYCRVSLGERQAACVYKPVAGERPLWDFATGSLAGREVSA
ncbi:MAG: hypothetical protein ABSA03_19220, partial [Streptosporangiaceae bacterium]